MSIASGLVLTEPRSLERRSFDLPEVDADDGLLRVEACGLCGTDHEQYTGHITNRHAFIPGHEVVGVVEELGDAAAERWGVSAGQRVAVEVFLSCRNCDQCRAGLYRRCERNGLATMVGFTDADTPPGLGGGYASHLYLRPDSMLMAVPDELDPVTATLFNPLGAGIRWAVEIPDTQPGDVVAILGPGVRGLCAAAAAKEAGAGFVMITGLGERDTERLALAPAFGADLAVDVSTDDPNRALRDAAGAKADVVIDVTAKAPAALAQAVQLARPGGTIVLAGTRGSPETPGFDPDHIVYKELRIFGALGVDVTAYRKALDLLVSGRYPFTDLPRQVADFDSLEPLIQTLAGERPGTPPVHGVFAPGSADS
ncbi:zinc-dependent alcohol dehydrogenase [Candidatus Poriferisodalis sp.]|uniref:zinc-dependent alcohol dehydrogenase n=1 Tax=Candidatus Poriferisodalis sp. TaxID=3101277 RepID=UPI003B0207B2